MASAPAKAKLVISAKKKKKPPRLRGRRVAARRPKRAADVESLQETFNTLAKRWRDDTAALSSPTAKAVHPAYQRIIGMGPRALPLILREMKREPDDWFWALTAITGEDPVPPEDAGDMDKMVDAWLRYGEQGGLL